MVQIKHSKYMDMSPIGDLEHFMCRMSKMTRDKLDVAIGDTVKLSNNNDNVVLKVGSAYEYDLNCYENFDGLFLSSYIYNKLSPLSAVNVAKVPTLTFGADPEAFLVSEAEGSLIDACVCFNTPYVGHDYGLVELRPDPADSIQGLIIHLFALIGSTQLYIKPGMYVRGGSVYDYQAAGFHIHFGLSRVMKEQTKQFMKALAGVLDFFVAVPSMYFEKDDDWYRRTNSDYGNPSDVRESKFSFEYRTLGAHIMADPRITCFIFMLAETIVTDLYNIYLEAPKVIDSYYNLQTAYPTLPSKELVTEMLTDKRGNEYAKRYMTDILQALNYFSKYDLLDYFGYIRNIDYGYNLVESWMFNARMALTTIKEV